MSHTGYIWIMTGQASGLPVYAADTKYLAYNYLVTRRSDNPPVRVFRYGGPKGIIEVCKRCFMNAPNQPVSEKGHS